MLGNAPSTATACIFQLVISSLTSTLSGSTISLLNNLLAPPWSLRPVPGKVGPSIRGSEDLMIWILAFLNKLGSRSTNTPNIVLLGITGVTTGARYHSIVVYGIIDNRVICHSSGTYLAFCLADSYFSVNC